MLRDQTKRKPVETFSPEEFQTFLGVVRPEWLPWLALGGLALDRLALVPVQKVQQKRRSW